MAIGRIELEIPKPTSFDVCAYFTKGKKDCKGNIVLFSTCEEHMRIDVERDLVEGSIDGVSVKISSGRVGGYGQRRRCVEVPWKWLTT